MKNKSRRKFLKNISLSFLSLSSLPFFLQSSNNRKENEISKCNPSTEDAYGQGPFYTSNAPFIVDNELANQSEIGDRIIISGRVFNLQCSQVIPNTEIDIWHANSLGQYDNLGFNLRGKVLTNSQGFYIFESIKPGFYLNGSNYRPSHIHFKITPPGFNTLITQLYFQDDPYIVSDLAASASSGPYDATHRIIPLNINSDGILEGTWDIVINGDGTSLSSNNIYLDKGMIYSATPNPFENEIEIMYGIFQKADVSISVCDINGHLIAKINEKYQKPQKYSVFWKPDKYLSKGHYFIILKLNDIQVHYIKVFKK